MSEHNPLYAELERLQRQIADNGLVLRQLQDALYLESTLREVAEQQLSEARQQLTEVEAEHGEQLRAMRSFSGDLEIRLEDAEKETRQEAKRANNAALRAERNALALADANAAKIKAEVIIVESQTRLAELMAERDDLRRMAAGKVWYWQGDGYDLPEFLTCPVLMRAETVRELIAAKEKAEAAVTLANEAVRLADGHWFDGAACAKNTAICDPFIAALDAWRKEANHG